MNGHGQLSLWSQSVSYMVVNLCSIFFQVYQFFLGHCRQYSHYKREEGFFFVPTGGNPESASPLPLFFLFFSALLKTYYSQQQDVITYLSL